MAENIKKPAIRFAGFTEAWEQRKLGEVVGTYDGVHQTPKYQDNGIMFLSVENIATLQSSKYISEDDFKRDYKVYPQENDILMTRIGDVGTTNVITDNGLKAYYVSLALLKYKSTNPYFLSNAIQSDYVKKGLANRTLKTAIPMKINKEEIGKVDVMLPTSVKEQTKIGEYFRNLDNLITLHQRKYDKFTNAKKSMLEKMFPKNGSNVPEIRFKGFTEAWEQRKLEEVSSEMVAGGDINKDLILDEGRYPVIANAITNNGIVGYYNEDYRIKSPAVTVTGRGDVGHAKARIIDFTPVVRLLTIKSNHDVFFLENSINTLKIVVESTGVPQLTVPQLAKYDIYFPESLDEEKKIGTFFRNLDNLITLHQRKLEKLKNIKKSMLEKMFI